MGYADEGYRERKARLHVFRRAILTP